MAGAVFGEVEVSLFVAGAAFGEIWNDSRSAKCRIFQYKKVVVVLKSNLGFARRVADDGFQLGSSSDRSRIVIDVSSAHCK